MLTVFVVLAALGFAAAIGGAIWWVAGSGQMRVRSGSEVGAEIMADLAGPDEDADQVEVISASSHRFKDTGIKAEGAAETSVGDLKQQIVAGRWRAVFPQLLAVAGLVITLLFGSLALLVGMENKLLGGVIAVIAVYTVARSIRDFTGAQAPSQKGK